MMAEKTETNSRPTELAQKTAAEDYEWQCDSVDHGSSRSWV